MQKNNSGIMKIIVNEEKRARTKYSTICLTKGKIYESTGIELTINNEPLCRVIDDSNEDYLYPLSLFDIVEE